MDLGVGESVWNQRECLARSAKRLRRLYETVQRPGDLALGMWAQFFAVAREFQPDLILELGRGAGNSTCAFLEAIHQNGRGRLVSVDQYPGLFEHETLPRLRQVVDDAWLAPADVRVADVMQTDFAPIVADSQRVLLLWDAHGAALADYILGGLMPLLEPRRHFVMVHDFADVQYYRMSPDYLRSDGERTFWCDHWWCPFDELYPLVDFLTRNRIASASAEASIDDMLSQDPNRRQILTALWGRSLDDATSSPLSTGGFLTFRLDMRWETTYPIAYPPIPETPLQESTAALLARIERELTGRDGARIVCFGAGNDFRSAYARGLFEKGRLVGLLDDRLPVGSTVDDVPVAAPTALASLQPDFLIVTTSAHRATLLERARGMVQALGLKTTIV